MTDNNSETNQLNQLKPNIFLATLVDWQKYKKIKLESLAKNPEAFSDNLEDDLKKNDQAWQMEMKSFCSYPKFVFLVELNSEMIGMGCARKIKNDKNQGLWYVYNVYVSDKIRGKGIGLGIMLKILEEIKKRGGKKVILFVRKEKKQDAARALYKKLGFELQKEQKFERSEGMEKDLTSFLL